ncbi:MAG: lactate racemase domain-containing protein, partial [Thermodesulfobacteriota bacterium]|nr:lactate racemase domain-containing protein [Thermodesulfobacteriota bacterium]
HNCYENLIFIGETTYGTPLYINRFFYEADFKIGIGMLSPHPYAGFSGGGKIVLPGISGMETIEANHKPVKKSLSGEIGKIEGNLRRAEIDEAAKIAGLNFIINTINNSEGKTAAIFSGEPEKTFNVAGKYAGEIYGTKSCYGMDIGIFNAFPKDTEMLQALNALNIWSTRDEKRSIVKKGGTIIIITAASEGCGFHGLGDKGMRMYVRRDNHGSFKELFNNRDFAFVSPNLIEGDIYDHYPSQVKLFKDWESCLDVLKGKFPEKARVAVYPCGPLQLEKS